MRRKKSLVKDSVFKYIEGELYDYYETRKDLDEEKLNIIEHTPEKGEGRSEGLVSQPTENRAVRIYSSRAIIRMTRVINAIDTALLILDTENLDARLLFNLRYAKKLSWQDICERMSISHSTLYRIRESLVYAVARQLGHL